MFYSVTWTHLCMCIYQPCLHKQSATQGQFLQQSLTGLNLEFFFSKNDCHTEIKEPNLLYNLPITGGRIVGSIPFSRVFFTIGWGCKKHWLLLCRGVRLPNKCPRYDTEQSDGEVPIMLELWGMWSTLWLPSLPGPLWPGVVAPCKIKTELLEIELFWHLDCILMLN